jgi:hypothetical protein
VAATANAARQIKLYVNGAEVDSKVYPVIADWIPTYGDDNKSLAIGTGFPYMVQDNWPGNTSLSFNGKMDHVRGYAKALSAEAIAKQADAPLGFWKFDESSGTFTADASGNGNTGELLGGAVWTSGSTGYGNAVLLDGSNDYVRVPSIAAKKFTGGELTLSARIFISPGEDTGGYVISKPWNGLGEYNYRLSLTNQNKLKFTLKGSLAEVGIMSTAALAEGVWHDVVATVDANNDMKLHVNGSEVASGAHTINDWTPTNGDENLPLAIGTGFPYMSPWAGNTSLSFAGKIDEVRIYRRALSEGQEQSMSGGRSFHPPQLEGSLADVASVESTKLVGGEHEVVGSSPTDSCASGNSDGLRDARSQSHPEHANNVDFGNGPFAVNRPKMSNRDNHPRNLATRLRTLFDNDNDHVDI